MDAFVNYKNIQSLQKHYFICNILVSGVNIFRVKGGIINEL